VKSEKRHSSLFTPSAVAFLAIRAYHTHNNLPSSAIQVSAAQTVN